MSARSAAARFCTSATWRRRRPPKTCGLSPGYSRQVAASGAEDPFILLVRPDPKPVEDFAFTVGEGSVGLVHPDTPHLADGLQAQGRMKWILTEEFELLIGLPLNVWRKGAIQFPKFIGGVRDKGHFQRLRALFIHRFEFPGANIGLDRFDNTHPAASR